MHKAIKNKTDSETLTLLDIHDKKRDIVGYIEVTVLNGQTTVTEYSLESSEAFTPEEFIKEVLSPDKVEILPNANIWTQ